MVEIKTASELSAMREAGRVVGRALVEVQAEAKAGVSLLELDELAHTVMREAGAKPSFLHYQPTFATTPFTGVLCTSVNDAIVHGIPSRYRLQDGDLVSIDCGAELDGWHGDAAVSIVIGTGTEADHRLIADTTEALEAGIAAAVVGGRIGDISHAVGTIGRARGRGIPADFGGHGVGRALHEGPALPNDGEPGRGMRLRPGLVLAIEPMFMAGGRDAYRVDEDGWTLRTVDGSRAAHVEHTVAVTEEGPRILTLP
ncbi:type I methionyl aminopeptidase [Actinoalloteichus hymeniacidonis]|uniref:Methionine aminopeptidase n=1 Tax=Actinoalloteichus hymeniacidonis TaxID=340345 RepID=A0AAC9MXB4_9PSEU|nr:type I methionyl aminopeptidase [Actinoalloteichus hymeniacidonis]AOS63043.1 methionine aminopeptidase, type I [Actinoalloteichus hymeniacidonis]MBB5908922.1 methionyl aminopeptidase [Actinoalloteichus hymeniacidonis]